jgi:dTDP-glucose pyrophosphorylase
MNKKETILENSVESSIRIIDALNCLDKLPNKTLLVHSSGKFYGTLTDGDIRRGLINKAKVSDTIENITNSDCTIINYEDFISNKFLKYHGSIDIVPVIKDGKIFDLYFNTYEKDLNSHSSDLSNLCNVLIMAGGKGTRMRPLTDFMPKPLVPLDGKTLIEHVMSNFSNFGMKQFSISVNYKSDQIVNYFKNKTHPYNLKYIDENLPMGTIGALQNLDFDNKSTFITNCDSLIDLDFYDMYEFHSSNNFDFTIAGCEDVISVPYGVCSVDKNSQLSSITEKPQIVNLINSGLYLCEENVSSLIPKNSKFDATDLISQCLKKNLKVGVYKFRKNQWRDIGRFRDYLSFL